MNKTKVNFHANWIKSGDQGTKFFARPRATRARHVRNSVMRILDSNDSVLTVMKERAVEYFEHMFASPERPMPIPNLNLVFDQINTVEENVKLKCITTMEEIKSTLLLMPKGKARMELNHISLN